MGNSKRATRVGVVVLGVVALGLSGSAHQPDEGGRLLQQQQQSPRQTTRTSSPGLYLTAPRTIGGLTALCDLVIYGTIETVEQTYLQSQAPGQVVTQPIIRLGVRVTTVAKGAAKAGDLIVVAQPGGSVTLGGTTWARDSSEFPILKVGESPILFLADWPVYDGYKIVLGPTGAVRTTGNTAHIPRTLRHIGDLAASSTQDITRLMDLLRRLEFPRSSGHFLACMRVVAVPHGPGVDCKKDGVL